MAINKTVNKRTTSHGAMRNCIEYVLKDTKITDGLVEITGPYNEATIDYDKVYNAFLLEKRLWGKDSGRMYVHNIISFHKDERISPEEAFDFGKEFAEKWFPNYQTLICVHQDRDHIHIHFVTNSVSFIDGKKLHTTKYDLQKMKNFTNKMCKERGLSIAEKGKHFDGTDKDLGDITAWSKDKYNLLQSQSKESFVADCALNILKVLSFVSSKEEFIEEMQKCGWIANWSDTRKHITFVNEKGQKVRDSNLEKTFNIKISKEDLNAKFIRQNDKGVQGDIISQSRLEQYYREVESANAIATRDWSKSTEPRKSDKKAISDNTISQKRKQLAKKQDRISRRVQRDASKREHLFELKSGSNGEIPRGDDGRKQQPEAKSRISESISRESAPRELQSQESSNRGQADYIEVSEKNIKYSNDTRGERSLRARLERASELSKRQMPQRDSQGQRLPRKRQEIDL